MIPNATWLIHNVFLSRPAVISSYVNDKSGRTRWGYTCMYVVGWSVDPDLYMDFLGYRYVAHNLTKYNIFLFFYYYSLIIYKSKIINL